MEFEILRELISSRIKIQTSGEKPSGCSLSWLIGFWRTARLMRAHYLHGQPPQRMNKLPQSAWNCGSVSGGQHIWAESSLNPERECAYNSWKQSRHPRNIQKDCLDVWENWESLNLAGVGNEREWKAVSKAFAGIGSKGKMKENCRLSAKCWRKPSGEKKEKKSEVLNAFVLFLFLLKRSAVRSIKSLF